MNIIFLSNYFNHHQKYLSNAFYEQTEGNYLFIETAQMDEERIAGGWKINSYPEYVVSYEKLQSNIGYYINLINNADVVISGSAPERYIRQRIRSGKILFRYYERIYKKYYQYLQLPIRALVYYLRNRGNKNIYLLCASAYAARDYNISGAFIGKCYQWGYFPETKHYDLDALMAKKRGDTVKICWCARFIDWKHPEIPVEAARRLKAEGYAFELNMIGVGPLQEKIRNLIARYGLEDCVHLLGAMPTEKVRAHMEESRIFLFTSDRNEGWGAVLNEAMNSGCAVIANKAIGSVPFLIKDGENGFISASNTLDNVCNKIKYLLVNTDVIQDIGMKAYQTMISEYNEKIAVSRFFKLIHHLDDTRELYSSGLCSKLSIV